VPMVSILSRRCPDWPRRRILLIGSLTFPALLALPCIWLLADAMLSTREECGVDACGMAMMFASIGLIVVLVGYVLGLAVSAVTFRFIRPKPDASQLPDIFQ